MLMMKLMMTTVRWQRLAVLISHLHVHLQVDDDYDAVCVIVLAIEVVVIVWFIVLNKEWDCNYASETMI